MTRKKKRMVSKYIDEYRSYLRDCLDDLDFDLTTLEDFDTWVEEEEQEKKIRCKKCGSLNTEQRGSEKHCTDCNQVEMITPNNKANWVGKAGNKQQQKTDLQSKEEAMSVLEKHLDKDSHCPAEVYTALHSLWEEATDNDVAEEAAFDKNGKCLKCGSRVSFADVTDTVVFVGDEIVKRHDGDITNRNCVRCTYPKMWPDYEHYDEG